MAFISKEKRESLIKKINKSYTFRKILIIFEMILLIGFIVMAFMAISHPSDYRWTWYAYNKLTNLGIGMLVWACVMTLLGIICLILILTLKSPKQITKEVSHLESSAIGGKKLKKGENSAKVYRDRTTSTKNKK